MIASLMMYARPELAGATERYWALIREEMQARGIESPEHLSQTAGEFEVWTAPDLVLSQTCGMPYRLWLHHRVTLIGTPDFGIEGCPPGYYRSAIVVRADELRDTAEGFRDAVFAYNQCFSQSGYAALYSHLKPFGVWFENRLQTGGHLMSARAVAEGRADIAALDAVSWRQMQAHDDFAASLRVLDWTDPTPGLPYIAAKGVDRKGSFDAVATAISRLQPEDRAALGLRGLVAIPKAAYLAIPVPEDVEYEKIRAEGL